MQSLKKPLGNPLKKSRLKTVVIILKISLKKLKNPLQNPLKTSKKFQKL
jgi:hypothetical protein